MPSCGRPQCGTVGLKQARGAGVGVPCRESLALPRALSHLSPSWEWLQHQPASRGASGVGRASGCSITLALNVEVALVPCNGT